jgi:hypothetical protein
MICFANPVLVYSAKRRIRILDERPSVFIRDNPIFSSVIILLKDYDRKGSAERSFSGRESEGA